jgi:hypothetical protein
VVVENRAGAGGLIGTEYASRQPADGYTLLVSHASVHIYATATRRSMPFDPVNDFTHMGMLVDAFYRTQALVFGAEASPSVVVAKVLCDQFLYSPFVATPLTCWLYDWKLYGYRLTGTHRFFTLAYARDVMVPVIFANWGVWIPVVSILYSLPSTLQIPLFGLALSLWVMLLTWISERRNSL